jgi:hypothetical protein
MSLVVSVDSGPFWRCDGCLKPITGEGLVLHAPLAGVHPLHTLQVHRECTAASLVKAMLPKFSSQPLSTVMHQLAETLAPEERDHGCTQTSTSA